MIYINKIHIYINMNQYFCDDIINEIIQYLSVKDLLMLWACNKYAKQYYIEAYRREKNLTMNKLDNYIHYKWEYYDITNLVRHCNLLFEHKTSDMAVLYNPYNCLEDIRYFSYKLNYLLTKIKKDYRLLLKEIKWESLKTDIECLHYNLYKIN